jgi:hypothetical protein
VKNKILAGGSAILVLTFLVTPVFAEDPSIGTLVFDVKSLESDVKIKKNVRKQLEHAGLRWGIGDNVLVIPLVNEKYVKSDLPHLTRYGETKLIDVEAGQYHITCIGYVHSSNSRDVEKVLSKSAFFNKEVMTFTVEPGKTTILEIRPVLQKQTKSSFLVKTKMFMPDLWTKVIEDGVETEETIINQRMATSISWDDYSGPLKF